MLLDFKERMYTLVPGYLLLIKKASKISDISIFIVLSKICLDRWRIIIDHATSHDSSLCMCPLHLRTFPKHIVLLWGKVGMLCGLFHLINKVCLLLELLGVTSYQDHSVIIYGYKVVTSLVKNANPMLPYRSVARAQINTTKSQYLF